jgi:lipoprotein NlpD
MELKPKPNRGGRLRRGLFLPFRLHDGQAPFLVLLFFLALALSGCGSTGPAPVVDGFGPAPDGYYRIRQGDTLRGIANRHRVDYRTLARWNKLDSPYRIYSGRLLRVEPPGGPGGGRKIAKSAGKSGTSSALSSNRTAKASNTKAQRPTGKGETVSAGVTWQWPMKGKVVQTYRRGDRTRQGIRIKGGAGQKVVAAAGGTVVYSGSGLKGYGNLIIVKHNNDYLSAYGFNRRLLVGEGARVKRGQKLAEVGQASSGDYLLHFEIRRNGAAEDPMRHLPGS